MTRTDVIEGVVIYDGPACEHCGRPVSNRGKPGPGGERYCSSRAECRRARDRAAHRRRMGDPGVEDRPCSRCGVSLPRRTKRVTDSPLGRWCLKSACQAERRKVTDPANLSKYREQYQLIVEARARLAAAPVADCESCGFQNGRVGYMHPRPSDQTMCFHQGEEYPARMPMGFEEMFGPGGMHAE